MRSKGVGWERLDDPRESVGNVAAADMKAKLAPDTGAVEPGLPARGKRSESHAQPVYTLGEEIFNSVSHGVGALLGIAALVLLIVRAAGSSEPFALASALVFGIALILEYTMSTLYHAIPPSKGKRVLRACDHSCIFVLIAGSYTPFLLMPLREHGGVIMMVIVWGLSLLGILMASIARDRAPKWAQPALCAVIGWLVIFRLPTLIAVLEPGCLALLASGGLAYTVGIAFFVMKKIPYMHSVWHLWVIAGSVLQFLAVYLYLF